MKWKRKRNRLKKISKTEKFQKLKLRNKNRKENNKNVKRLYYSSKKQLKLPVSLKRCNG